MRYRKEHIVFLPEQQHFDTLLTSNFIGNLTGVVDEEHVSQIGLENEGHEDYIFCLNVIKKIGVVRGIRIYLPEHRKTKRGISKNKFRSMVWQWNIYRIHAGQSLIK